MRFTHQPGAQPLAGYTIQRGIHRGGFGEVYYARSEGGKEVALKLLQREQDIELRGVRQCLNMKHPNLVNLFDVRTDDEGEQWVVMEYVNGTSLEDVLASFPNGLPIDEVQDWLAGIAAGVTYLHDRGIVHRDLKPANVYRENGTVKVGDVGLSKRLGSDRRTAQTQSVGTVYYMAPEVANGQYGPEVDVYSLGIMTYEMLTGSLPFMGETTAEVLMKHLTATPNLDGIPESLKPVIARALAKSPASRTSSVAQLNEEFQAAVVGRSAVVAAGHSDSRPGAMAAIGNLFRTPLPMADTPSNAQRETIRPLSVATSTKTTAQSASAYAHYPPAKQPPPVPESVNSTTKRHTTRDRTPTQGATTRRRTTAAKGTRTVPARSTVNWPLILTGLVGLLIFAPGSWRSWSGIGLLGVAYAATSVLRGRNGSRLDTSLISMDPTVDVEVCTPTSETHQALGDAAASLTVGSVSAALVSVGTLLSTEFFQRSPRAPSPEFLTLFVSTSLAATWLVLLGGQLRQRVRWMEKKPRTVSLGIGAMIGMLAYGLDQYLLAGFDGYATRYSPAFRSLGVHPLVDSSMNPTMLGYVIFFGGLVFLQSWWFDTSRHRSRQLGLGQLVAAGIAGWLMTVIFAFPQWPAVLWAVTISAAAQLATPWSAIPRHTARRA
ncbi:MAG: serine/threonine protein kinase [Planctomycetes bacterium]|nr:serine/threonine protein kinase [Planctomycetota bacterium]